MSPLATRTAHVHSLWLHHVKMLQPLAGYVLKESARRRTVSVVEAGVVFAGVAVRAGVGVAGEPAGSWLRRKELQQKWSGARAPDQRRMAARIVSVVAPRAKRA